MSLKHRINKLEAMNVSQDSFAPIIVISGISPAQFEHDPVPKFAYFTGFVGQQLTARPNEPIEELEARCEAHLAHLQERSNPEKRIPTKTPDN